MKKQDLKQIEKAVEMMKSLTPFVEESRNKAAAYKALMDEKAGLDKVVDQMMKYIEPLEEIADNMDDTYYNRSERWQESDKGYQLREWIDSTNDAVDCMKQAVESLEALLGEM